MQSNLFHSKMIVVFFDFYSSNLYQEFYLLIFNYLWVDIVPNLYIVCTYFSLLTHPVYFRLQSWQDFQISSSSVSISAPKISPSIAKEFPVDFPPQPSPISRNDFPSKTSLAINPLLFFSKPWEIPCSIAESKQEQF